ncbi:MAG TPA: hypothetical protein VFR85_16170 [Anaeromyxobacteraceae bacterium]|nr:hypothetical protein [Anaeromyxobacteraceae bacterium]
MAESRRIPPSIHVALLSLLLVVSVQTGLAFLLAGASRVGFFQYLFAAAVALLLVWGIVRGARLAWMWGRPLGFFLALVPLAAIGLGLWKGLAMRWWEVAIVALGLSAPLLASSIALGRPAALEFFDLVCPRCGTVAKRGKDFLFRQALCGKCGHVW